MCQDYAPTGAAGAAGATSQAPGATAGAVGSATSPPDARLTYRIALNVVDAGVVAPGSGGSAAGGAGGAGTGAASASGATGSGATGGTGTGATGGTGTGAGGTGTGAGTGAVAGTGGAGTGASLGVSPKSAFCGDAVRDPATEECDDDPELEGVFCTARCQRVDAPVVSDGVAESSGHPLARHLGLGRHPLAASPAGFAAAFIQTGPLSDEPRVRLSTFDALGRRKSLVEASRGLTASADANPVVAMRPNGDVYVALTDFEGDGDGKGIALRPVRAGQTIPDAFVYRPTAREGAQYDADLLALSDRLVLAYVDGPDARNGPDLRLEELDFQLQPLAVSQRLATAAALGTGGRALADTAEPEGRVTLFPLGQGYGVAWRRGQLSGGEVVEVVDATSKARWSVGFAEAASSEDSPVVVELDARYRLLIMSAAVSAAPGDIPLENLYA